MSSTTDTNKTGNASKNTSKDTPKDTSKDTNTDMSVKTDATPATTDTDNTTKTKKTAIERLREKSEKAQEKELTNRINRMGLFESTNASEWETTGTAARGTMKLDEGSMMVQGRNIGAEQKEPKWTPEQMKVLRQLCNITLPLASVTDTRRSVMDPEQEYVGRDSTGTLVPTEKAYVSNLDPSEYCVGTGQEKFDTTGSPRFYSDLVVADINGNWLVNQWTSDGIVIEGVANNVLMQKGKVGNQSGRRIGYDFARVGLPKMGFGPLFATLNAQYPGCTGQAAETDGYYWMNASWGVSSFQGTFAYMGDNGAERTTNLIDVMRMLQGKSGLCLATLAISVTTKADIKEGKAIKRTGEHGLSVKLHNAFCIDIVDFHGPPQQGATGMVVPSRYLSKARVMSKPGAMGNNVSNSSSIFANAGKGLFGQANAQPPSIKSADATTYM